MATSHRRSALYLETIVTCVDVDAKVSDRYSNPWRNVTVLSKEARSVVPGTPGCLRLAWLVHAWKKVRGNTLIPRNLGEATSINC